MQSHGKPHTSIAIQEAYASRARLIICLGMSRTTPESLDQGVTEVDHAADIDDDTTVTEEFRAGLNNALMLEERPFCDRLAIRLCHFLLILVMKFSMVISKFLFWGLKMLWTGSIDDQTINFASRYSVGRFLARGGCGMVYVVRDKTSKVERCLKTVVKSNQPVVTDSDRRAVNEIKREIDILKSLDHPHIVKLYESVEDSDGIHVVLEHCKGGDLDDHFMYSGVVFDEPYIARIMKQVLQAVSYCHKRHIVHKDIKLDNVMLDVTKQEVKLIDFGMSEIITDGQITPSFSQGSIRYMPPEAFIKEFEVKSDLTFKSDIWSIGVALYVMATGGFLYGERSKREIVRLMRSKIPYAENTGFEKLSKELRALIRKMLTIDPANRPTADECLQHKWFSLAPNDKVTEEEEKTIFKNMKAFSKRGQLYAAMCNFAERELPCDTTDSAVKLFKNLDVNNNGVLTADQLKNYLISSSEWTDKDIRQLLRVIDVHDNGVITFSEFIAACRNWKGERNEVLFSFLFLKLTDYYNSEGSEQETNSRKDIEKLMSAIGTNSDGKITDEAFVDYMTA